MWFEQFPCSSQAESPGGDASPLVAGCPGKTVLLTAYAWQGGFDGNVWQSGQNWLNVAAGQTNQGVPGSTDTATVVGGPAILLNADVAVNRLEYTQAATNVFLTTFNFTLTMNDALIQTGNFSGNFISNGTMVFDVTGGGSDGSIGAPQIWGSLTNNGTIDLQRGVVVTSGLSFGNPIGVTITNPVGSEIRMADGTSFLGANGPGRILNSGTIHKAAGNGVGTIATPLTNEATGRLDVDAGSLVLTGVMHRLGGTIDVAPGTTLESNMYILGGSGDSGDVFISSVVSVTGGGKWRHHRGELIFSGGTIQSTDSTVLIQGDAADDAGLATVKGFGTFNVADLQFVKGRIGVGQFGGSPAINVFTNNGTIAIAGTGPDDTYLGSATLVNNGSVTFNGANNSFALVGAALDNRPSGVIAMLANATVNSAAGNGVGPSFLKNSGKVIVGSSVTTVSLPGVLFQNSAGGVLDVLGGTLDLSSIRNWANTPDLQSFSTGGHFIVAAGASLNLVNPSQGFPIFTGTYTGSGAGAVRIGNNAFSNAVLDFPLGMVTWTYGILTGSVTNRGQLTLQNANPGDQLGLSAAFANEGTLHFGPASVMTMNVGFVGAATYGPATLTNRHVGVIELSDGSHIIGGSAGQLTGAPISLLINEGLFRLSSGAVTIIPKFDNFGTVDSAGALTFLTPRPIILTGDGLVSLPGEWIARAGGQISFPNDASFFDTLDGRVAIIGAGSSFIGIGEVANVRGELSLTGGATMAVLGSLTNSGSIVLGSSSTLSVPANYTQTVSGALTTLVGGTTQFGYLAVAGSVALAGTLVTGLEQGFEPLESDRFDVVTATAVDGLFSVVNSNALGASVLPTKVTLGLLASASDLAVSNVESIGAAGPWSPGQTVQIRYTVRNLSAHTVNGPWTDLLFLSQDFQLDSGDITLARSAVTSSLPAFGSVTLTETITVPDRPGSAFILVAADATGVVFDLNRHNNTGSTTTAVRISAAMLPFDTNVSSNAAVSEAVYYELTVSAGLASVRVQTTFPLNDSGELRIRRGSLPDNPNGDLVAAAIVSGTERVAVLNLDNALPGVYYVAVISRAAGAVTTRADNLSLSLTGFENESQLANSLIAGDSLALTVLGSGFNSQTHFQLGTMNAVRTEILSPSKAVVTFSNLSIGGPFFVSASAGAASDTWSGKAFTVVAAGTTATDNWARQPNWHIEINMPDATRPLREIPVIITFQNASSISQPAPVLQVVTDNGTFRFADDKEYGGSFALALGVKSTGRPDLYAPGETGSARFFLFPVQNGAHVATQVGAAAMAERALTIRPGLSDSINPSSTPILLDADFFNNLRPSSIAQVAWDNAVRPALAGLIGTTLETYAAAIRDAATVLARDGVQTQNPSRSIAWLINLADRFGEIHQRFELTAFGRGQENPFDVQAIADADGNVTVHTGFAMRRFDRIGSQYAGAPGDRGQLATRGGGGYLLNEASGRVTAFSADGKLEYTETRLGLRTTAGYLAGRMITITDAFGDVTTIGYNAAGRIISVTDPVGRPTTYSYDAGGERLLSFSDAFGTTTMIWNADTTGPRAWTLSAVTTQDGVRTDFTYDGVGRQSQQAFAGGVQATTTASYVIGGGLEAAYDSSGVGSFYNFDITGNTTSLTAADGSVSASYRYLPFGETLSATGAGVAANKYTFNGQFGVAQRGSVGFDMRARVYDSATGRFTQQDPIGFGGGDVNVYRYTANDPVSFVDPSGWFPDPFDGTRLSTSSSGGGSFGQGPKQPPRPPIRPRVPPVTPPVAEEIKVVVDKTTLSGQKIGGSKAARQMVVGLSDTFGSIVAKVPGARILGRIGSASAGVVGRLLSGPAGVVLLLSGSVSAEEFPIGHFQIDNLIKIRTQQHPGLAAKIAKFRMDHPLGSGHFQDPNFEELIDLLICVKQGEAKLRSTSQQTPTDPNEIVGPAGVGTPGYLTTPAEFPYTVYFQNIPTAAVPAQEVFVTQQLDADLDWASFELTGFGWGANTFAVPAGLKTYHTRVNDAASGLAVDVTANFNVVHGQLSWTFRSLDPVTFDLPWDGTQGFLPPDDASGRGQGFVGYHVRPKLGALNGTEYTAAASIVFDTEAPLASNTWLNTLDLESPTSSVLALPANVSTASFSVNWSGTDGAGSGIGTYDIYVSGNGGPYVLWQSGVATTTATFTGQSGQTYRFISMATDNVGHQQPAALAPQATTTVAALHSVISAPAPATQLMRPTIQWSAIDGVSVYELYLTNRSTNQDPAIRTLVSGTSFVPLQELGIGKFRVWVRGKYNDGTYTSWSAPHDFVINTQAAFRSMPTSQNTGFPIFEWQTISGAARYDLWIDNLSTGQSQFIRKQNLMSASFTPETELPLGRYRLWVRGIDAGDIAAIWSAPLSVSVLTPPIVVTPGPATFSTTPQFSWNPVPGATRYDLWVDNVTTGASEYIREQNLTPPGFTPTTAMPVGNYQFWVRAFGPGGLLGRFSAGRPLNIGGKPSVLAPLGVTASMTPLISWTPVDGAARYDLWINRTDVAQPQIVRETTLMTAQFQTPVLPLGTYRVWVRALTTAGVPSDWSDPLSFSIDTVAAMAPTVLQPPAATFNVRPTFTWTAMRGATTYLLFVRNEATSAIIIRQPGISGTSFTPAAAMAVGNYRVWVRAYAGNDPLGEFSAPRDFVIDGSLVRSVSPPDDNELLFAFLSDQLRLWSSEDSPREDAARRTRTFADVAAYEKAHKDRIDSDANAPGRLLYMRTGVPFASVSVSQTIAIPNRSLTAAEAGDPAVCDADLLEYVLNQLAMEGV